MTEGTIFRVRVSPGSAERTGITNHHLIAYHTLSAITLPKITKIG